MARHSTAVDTTTAPVQQRWIAQHLPMPAKRSRDCYGSSALGIDHPGPGSTPINRACATCACWPRLPGPPATPAPLATVSVCRPARLQLAHEQELPHRWQPSASSEQACLRVHTHRMRWPWPSVERAPMPLPPGGPIAAGRHGRIHLIGHAEWQRVGPQKRKPAPFSRGHSPGYHERLLFRWAPCLVAARAIAQLHPPGNHDRKGCGTRTWPPAA